MTIELSKKSILSMAIKTALVGSLAVSVTGCFEDTTQATQPNVVRLHDLKGTVTGFVFDTNGAPIINATVSLNGEMVMTDEKGAYVFTNVSVTGVAGADANTNNASLLVSVMAEGFASGTISVTNRAQVEGTNNDGGSDDSFLQTFVDGFVATANIVLPKMESTINGNLRLPNGQPAAGVTLALDFTGVNPASGGLGGNGNTNTQVGNATSLGVPVFRTTTDANGDFAFTSLPTDSNFTLVAEGWTTTGGAQQLAAGLVTTFDTTVHFAGNFTVIPITSADGIAPVISSVGNVISGAAVNRATLNVGVDGTAGLTITFTEALQQLVTASNVYVYSQTNMVYKSIASVTQSTDGMSLTITLTDAIEEGEQVDVLLMMAELLDLADNGLSSTESDNGLNPADLAYTSPNATQGTFLEVRLQGFSEATTTTGISSSQIYSVAAADVTAFENTVEDLGIAALENSAQLNVLGTAERLLPRLDAEDDGALNASVTADDDVAWLTVSLLDGVSYDIMVMDSNGDPRNVTVWDEDGAVINNPPNVPVSALTGLTAENLVIRGVQPGDVVTLTPNDDFGNPGAAVTVTLQDAVPPTTALQESYGLGANMPLVVTAEAGLPIDGGENVGSATSASVGSPLIHVTPRLLAGSDVAWANGTDGASETGIFGALTSGITDTDATTNNVPANAYTADNWTTFAAAGHAATMGAAFTEAVTLLGTPAWAGAAGMSGFAAAAGVNADNTDTIGDGTDFVGLMFTVDNIMTLASDARSANNQMDFTSTVSDGTNVSDSTSGDRAQVAFADAVPPFMTSGVLTTSALTLMFNESVDDTINNVLTMRLISHTGGAGQTLTALGYTAGDVTISGNTVTLSNANLTAAQLGTIRNLFSNASVTGTAEADDLFDFTEGGTLRGHAIANFGTVGDVATGVHVGVSWNEYLAGTINGNAVPRLDMTAIPQFLAYTDIPLFAASVAVAGASDGDADGNDDDGAIIVTISFTHAINTGNIGDGADPITAAELRNLFRLDLDGAGGAAAQTLNANSTVTLSADNMTVTVSLDEGLNVLDIGTTLLQTRTAPLYNFTSAVAATGNVTITQTLQ